MMEIPCAKSCKNIEHATVYRPAPGRRTGVVAFGVVLYALVLPLVFNTMGEPRNRAMVEAEMLQAKKLEAEDALFEEGEESVSWDEDDSAVAFGDDEEVLSAVPDDDFMGEDDAKDTVKVKVAKKKGGNETEEEEEEERPLPSPYLPDAVAAAALFCLMTGTALFHLLCHWFVWFHAFFYFERVEKVTDGTYIYVLPYAYRGRPELVPVKMDAKSGNYQFEFQRQKFELVKDAKLAEVKLLGVSKAGEQVDHDDEDLIIQKLTPEQLEACEKQTRDAMSANGAFQPVVARLDLPVSFYLASRGLKTQGDVEAHVNRYGVNSLQIEMKTMPMLIKEGLLSPLSMFQFFSTALWLMDEYWQYTIFNLLSIVMMEGLTAFQRFRTLRTLKGLAPQPYELPVYRGGQWLRVRTTDLLPGDLVSLSSSAHTVNANQPSTAKSGTDAVPCDCLILYGSAVVNEATLTGESVPQMKDALKKTTHADSSVPLEIQGRDRVHVMFSGTTLISATPGEAEGEGDEAKGSAKFPKSPDGGCLCYVLRTGFGSSQGELMQMIEFSTEQVSSDSKETGIALFVLLIFALVSAGYVFKKGMEKGDRTTHELLLKCVIILTSVVPRQLPIQMALAVNHALMTLMKEGIFCTEPYRVPYAGKITHCLFDKTGTLTTDELVPVGIVNNEEKGAKKEKSSEAKDLLVPVKDASVDATMVLAACHSLVAMPEVAPPPGQAQVSNVDAKVTELLGDPIELAAMKGVQWNFDPKKQEATPGDVQALMKALVSLKQKQSSLVAQIASTQQVPELTGGDRETQIKSIQANIKKLQEQQGQLEKSLDGVKAEAAKYPIQGIKILQRFHFSSKLQRMSVLCKVRRKGSSEYESAPYCFVKGSPEALMKLIKPEAIPAWYKTSYRVLAEEGMRVLALGYKTCDPSTNVATLARDEAEAGLQFAGFIAFECKTRADSAMVIKSLREADHRVAMITGDAPLTALHVAKITNICGDETRKSNPPLLLSLAPKKSQGVEWVGAIGPEEECVHLPFAVEKIPELSEKHDLLTTEDALLEAVNLTTGKIWQFVERFQVFARMSPQGKAKIIRMIQQFQDGSSAETESFVSSSQKNFVLMCGDGGNDVGALKQADVGLALLSGYGNANTDEGKSGDEVADGDAESALNNQAKELQIRAKFAEKQKKAEFELKRKEILGRQKVMVMEEVAKLEAAGQTGMWTQVTAVKNVTQRVRAELQREAEILNRKYNIATTKKKSIMEFDPNKDPTELAMEAMDDPNALPVVRPGDASVAAPFTSRMPSVRSVVQLIRQGRCTLLSALMQQQIMMLESVISAYCLAALSLEGARSSERQMMASSWLIMTASLAFSYSTPIEKMHPVRPIRSLFHPAIFISILGQAAIHLFCMVTAVELAKSTMGEAKLKEVVAFNRRVSRGLEKKLEQEAEGLDAVAEMMMLWSNPFMPNLMNTVIFLVETSQIMAVLFVNYKGRPFMLGMLENSALFLSLFISISALVFFSWEMSPELNKLIHLHPFPDDEFRFKVLGLVLMTLFGSFAFDRLVTAIFAPRIFGAMFEQAKQTSLKDLLPVFMTLGKVLLGFGVLASGNPLIWFGAWWLYKKRQASLEAQELAQISGVQPGTQSTAGTPRVTAQ